MKRILMVSGIAIFSTLLLTACGDSKVEEKTSKNELKVEEVVQVPKIAVCEDVTENTTACEFKDGVAAYHTRNGLFITSEIQGTTNIGISSGVRAANSHEDGVKNTAAILEHSSVFPAAHICNDLGEGWYLPATKEFEGAFMYIPRDTDLLNHQFLTSTFIRDGFGTETVGMLDSNSQYFYPALKNAGMMRNRNEYSVLCARQVVTN